jgi:DNA-directed RNA polymerase beta subunit
MEKPQRVVKTKLNNKKESSDCLVGGKTSCGNINNLSTEEFFRLVDLHFNKKNYIFRHLYDSYDKLLEEDTKNFLKNGETEKAKHFAIIPQMVRSKCCNIYSNKDMDKNEYNYIAGGYFIVNGNEKVVLYQDRMVENNKPLVFVKKDSGAQSYIV